MAVPRSALKLPCCVNKCLIGSRRRARYGAEKTCRKRMGNEEWGRVWAELDMERGPTTEQPVKAGKTENERELGCDPRPSRKDIRSLRHPCRSSMHLIVPWTSSKVPFPRRRLSPLNRRHGLMFLPPVPRSAPIRGSRSLRSVRMPSQWTRLAIFRFRLPILFSSSHHCYSYRPHADSFIYRFRQEQWMWSRSLLLRHQIRMVPYFSHREFGPHVDLLSGRAQHQSAAPIRGSLFHRLSEPRQCLD